VGREAGQDQRIAAVLVPQAGRLVEVLVGIRRPRRARIDDRCADDDTQVARAREARDFLGGVQGRCRLDFTRLDYIASAGLGILIAVQRRLRDQGGGLVLAGLSPHLREVLQLAGFEGVFEFE